MRLNIVEIFCCIVPCNLGLKANEQLKPAVGIVNKGIFKLGKGGYRTPITPVVYATDRVTRLRVASQCWFLSFDSARVTHNPTVCVFRHRNPFFGRQGPARQQKRGGNGQKRTADLEQRTGDNKAGDSKSFRGEKDRISKYVVFLLR